MSRLRLDNILQYSWVLLWFVLPLSLKASVAALWLFGILAITAALVHPPHSTRAQRILFLAFLLFFLIHLISYATDPAPGPAWKNLERKFPLVVIPLALLLASDSLQHPRRWAVRGLIAGLAISGLHMIGYALMRFLDGGGPGVWMYHEFTSPYPHGAIYYSWYLCIALVCLAFPQGDDIPVRFRLPLIILLLLLLLLASSKLFILLTLPLLAWRAIILRTPLGRRPLLTAGVITLIVAAGLPFLIRMSELRNTDPEIAFQQEYRYDTPFNGATIRILQWRFGREILAENNAWASGVGIGSKQLLLDAYYRRFGVYTGNPELGDSGYLGYNFHNQFIETAVGTGITGVLILLVLIVLVLRTLKRLAFPWPVYLFTLAFFLTESVLERQAGIVMFCLLGFTFIPIHETKNAG